MTLTKFPMIVSTVDPRNIDTTPNPEGRFETATCLSVVEQRLTPTASVEGKTGTTEVLITRTALVSRYPGGFV